MLRQPRLLAPGVLYHVIVRGNHRQKTFLSQSDYQAYLEKLGRVSPCGGSIVQTFKEGSSRKGKREQASFP